MKTQRVYEFDALAVPYNVPAKIQGRRLSFAPGAFARCLARQEAAGKLPPVLVNHGRITSHSWGQVTGWRDTAEGLELSGVVRFAAAPIWAGQPCSISWWPAREHSSSFGVVVEDVDELLELSLGFGMRGAFPTALLLRVRELPRMPVPPSSEVVHAEAMAEVRAAMSELERFDG